MFVGNAAPGAMVTGGGRLRRAGLVRCAAQRETSRPGRGDDLELSGQVALVGETLPSNVGGRPAGLERAASGEGSRAGLVPSRGFRPGSESPTMGWVAFLIAVLYVCLGFAAGTLLSRRNAAAAAASAPEPPPDEDQPFTFRSDQAAEFLDRIHKLTSNVRSEEHTSELQS